MNEQKLEVKCPHCNKAIIQGDEEVSCPGCGIVYHKNCWESNKKCSKAGCDGWPIYSSETAEIVDPKQKHSAQESIKILDTPNTPKQQYYCIQCNEPVKESDITCARCRRKSLLDNYNNCLAPSILILGSTILLIVLILRALT